MREVTIGNCTLYNGDMRDVLATLSENSVDSIVCDPPYHLTSIVKRFADGAPAQYGKDGAFQRASAGFMGKQWDGGDIAFQPETWAACLRVLKPGGYILAFASTRGFGRMSAALEDAGFITHPMIAWVFGSGFPKATQTKVEGMEGWRYGGQALKPAMEPIYMGQKPFSEKTGTANIKRWGTGAINIDGCRVGTEGARNNGRQAGTNGIYGEIGATERVDYGKGRWPANLIHDGSDEVLAAFPNAPGQMAASIEDGAEQGNAVYGKMRRGGPNHIPRIESDKSAARFFYCAKASRKDREDGLDGRTTETVGDGRAVAADNAYQRGKTPRANTHPTVKPTSLMRYLCRLVTPTGGIVLDPFMGSGSTGKAAAFEGMRFIGIEREAEYLDIAKARVEWAIANRDMQEARPIAAQAQPGAPSMSAASTRTAANDNQWSLFDAA